MSASLKPLSAQVIVITGASNGIGLVTARMAAKAGAAVMLAARNKAALRNLAHELRENGARAEYAMCEVGQEADIERLTKAAREMLEPEEVAEAIRSVLTRSERADVVNLRIEPRLQKTA